MLVVWIPAVKRTNFHAPVCHSATLDLFENYQDDPALQHLYQAAAEAAANRNLRF